MRRVRRLACIWLAAGLAAAAVSALEVPLRYVSYADPPEPGMEYRPSGGFGVSCGFREQRGVKYPKAVSAFPAYGSVRLGERQAAFMLDTAKAEDDFYTVLRIDFDCDGDLTDETALTGTSPITASATPYRRTQFPATDVSLTVGGEETPYRLMAYIYCSNYPALRKSLEESGKDRPSSSPLSMIVHPQCCYRGDLVSGGKTYRVLLADSACNGLFSDAAALSRVREDYPEFQQVGFSGDHFYAVEEGATLSYYDRLPLGTVLAIGNDVYDVKVDIAGKRLVLTPRTEGLVSVRLGMSADRVGLVSEEGGVMIVDAPGETVRIPAGAYRVVGYRSLREWAGETWELVAVPTKDSPVVTVATGGEEAPLLPFGAPYVPTAYVSRWDREAFMKGSRKDVRVSCAAIGRGGEVITSLYKLGKDGRSRTRPSAPAYMIVGADGEVAAQGDFEYG